MSNLAPSLRLVSTKIPLRRTRKDLLDEVLDLFMRATHNRYMAGRKILRKIKGKVQGSVNIVVLLVMIFAGWFFLKTAIIYFRRSEIENMMSSLVLANRQSFDESAVVTLIAEKLKGSYEITVDPTAVIVYRTLDGNRVRVEVAYLEPMRLPKVEWGWDKDMTAAVNEVLIVK